MNRFDLPQEVTHHVRSLLVCCRLTRVIHPECVTTLRRTYRMDWAGTTPDAMSHAETMLADIFNSTQPGTWTAEAFQAWEVRG